MSRGRNLEEVTRELLTLQTISNAMISTTFLDEILEIVVDGLEKGLQYTAAILFIMDHDSQKLYPHLTHRNTFTQAVEEALGCSFSSITIGVADKHNLLAEAMQKQKILQSDHLFEVLQGAVNLPPDLGDRISQKTGVKKYMVVPLVIRDQAAGVILCAAPRPEIMPHDLESLKNFGNQVSVALDNIQMLNSLKSTQAELSRQNDRLNKAFDDLKNLEQLKDGLVGMVVHDLKNPLQSIRGYLELILETTEEKAETRLFINYIKKAYEGSEELLKMIHNLLDISRMEEGKFSLNTTQGRIEDVLAAVVDQLQIVAQQNQRTLSLEKAAPLPPLVMDPDILQRVVGNLISNAIKHTPREGKITVRAKTGPERGLTISVEDNGEGIPAEYLETVFEKFSQVKGQGYRNTHNVGLGLTFCKMAVETHGGRIWVDSKIDRGSTFHVWLPLMQGGA